MWSKWFGGGKKKQSPEEKWAKELVELKLKGYLNTKRNVELLEMYQGNEDLVIRQLDIDSPKPKMHSAEAFASAAASVLPPKPKLLEPKPEDILAEALASAAASDLRPKPKLLEPKPVQKSSTSEAYATVFEISTLLKQLDAVHEKVVEDVATSEMVVQRSAAKSGTDDLEVRSEEMKEGSGNKEFSDSGNEETDVCVMALQSAADAKMTEIESVVAEMGSEEPAAAFESDEDDDVKQLADWFHATFKARFAQYLPILCKHGFDSIEMLAHLNNDDINAITGIPRGHCRHIVRKAVLQQSAEQSSQPRSRTTTGEGEGEEEVMLF